MTLVSPARTNDDLARLGIQMYDRYVKAKVVPADGAKFVAIDVLTGDFEIDEDDYATSTRLARRKPDADVWIMRADGSPAYRMRTAR